MSKPASASKPGRAGADRGRVRGRWGSRQAEVAEDGVYGFGCGDEGEDVHLGAAAGAEHGEDLVDAREEASRTRSLRLSE
jgi:hypothetical protein